MKVLGTDVLLDSCVWGGAKPVLQDAGYDTVWVRDFLNDPGDEAIIALAYQENRVLVTLDKDFGELAVMKNVPHRGIIRIVDFPAQDQGPVCVQLLQKYTEELRQSALITADRNRVRVRSKDH